MRIACCQTLWLIGMAAGAGFIGGAAVAQDQPGVGGAASAPTGTVAPPMMTGQAVPCVDGMAGAFPCRRMDLLAYLPAAALGGAGAGATRLTDLWGWRDSVTRREFLLVARLDGTAFLEVTNPTAPRYLGELPRAKGTQPGARHLAVYRQYAYIVADSAPMQIVDLSQLRAAQGAPTTLQETAQVPLRAQGHTFTLDPASGFVYTNCRDWLYAIDLRLPTAPRPEACAEVDYSHHVTDRQLPTAAAAQCVLYRGPDALYRGRRICFGGATVDAGKSVLAIGDLTGATPRDRWILSLTSYPKADQPGPGTLSADGRYFFLTDAPSSTAGDTAGPRTVVFDVSQLGAPVALAQLAGAAALPVHDLEGRGSYLYQAHGSAGVRVLDVRDPTKPREAGFFGTVPVTSEAARDGGAWRVYPFVGREKDGVVAVANGTGEVFLVRFRP